MNKIKHTPGPWTLDRSRETDGCVVITDERKHYVAQIYRPAWTYLEEDQANAHLIAAAPELLAVVHEIVRLHETGAPLSNLFDVVSAARAAIAKATGAKHA